MRMPVEQEVDLLRRVGHRIGPATELQFRMPFANHLAQLPCVLDAARAADVLVTTEDDERREAVMNCLIGVAETEVDRMLGGQERDDVIARGFSAEIGHEVTQVVLFLRSSGAVGDHHPDALPGQRADRACGV